MAPDQDPTQEPAAEAAEAPEPQLDPREQQRADDLARFERTGKLSLGELNRRQRMTERAHRPLTPQQELEALRREKQQLGQQLAAARAEAKEVLADARRQAEALIEAAKADARQVRKSANAEADAIVGEAVTKKAAADGRELPPKVKTKPAKERASED